MQGERVQYVLDYESPDSLTVIWKPLAEHSWGEHKLFAVDFLADVFPRSVGIDRARISFRGDEGDMVYELGPVDERPVMYGLPAVRHGRRVAP